MTFEGCYNYKGNRVENWKYRDEKNTEMLNILFIFSGGGYFNKEG